MNMIFTTAGLDELAALIAAGDPVQITQLAIGTGNWTPDETATALNTELKRLDVTGDKTAEKTVHLTAVDQTTAEYTIYEVGVYLASGTLLAIAGDGEPITGKAARTTGVFAIELPLAQFSDAEVVIGGTGFMLPSATESVAGLAVLATTEEMQSGTDTAKAATPAGVKAALDNRSATIEATGLVELATNAETITGSDSSRAATPAGVKAAIDARTASTTQKGIVELATNEETTAGTDTERAATPSGVKAFIDSLGLLGADIVLIWTGSASGSLDLTTLPGGHPGDGLYVVKDANDHIGHILIKTGMMCSNVWQVGSNSNLSLDWEELFHLDNGTLTSKRYYLSVGSNSGYQDWHMREIYKVGG